MEQHTEIDRFFRDDFDNIVKNHGGVRPGSGRKKKSDPKKMFSVRLDSDLIVKIKSISEYKKISQAKLIELSINSYGHEWW